jgi:hypothetical protein
MYFDDSLYENEMHYKISQYLDEYPINTLPREHEEEYEDLKIVADNAEQYNEILDSLYHYKTGKLKMSGTPKCDVEVIIDKDPREGYRKFDENLLMQNKEGN